MVGEIVIFDSLQYDDADGNGADFGGGYDAEKG